MLSLKYFFFDSLNVKPVAELRLVAIKNFSVIYNR